MYAKEDKERILADQAASGLPIAVFAKQPGMPTRNTLRTWQAQAEAGELNIPTRFVRGHVKHTKHSHYPEATKREAVALRRAGMRWCDIARRLGVSSGSVVASWTKPPLKPTIALKEAGGMTKRSNLKDTEREELLARIAELEKDNSVMLEMMRDPKVGYLESLSKRQKIESGERLRKAYGFCLNTLTAFLGIPRSTYMRLRKKMLEVTEELPITDQEITERVLAAFYEGRHTYGYRRVHALVNRGLEISERTYISERKVRKVMKEENLQARRTKKKQRYNSYTGEPDKRPANAPLKKNGKHDFSPPAPDMLVVSDVTEFHVGGRKVYLAPILDCYDGFPAAWSISMHPDAKLCESALRLYAQSLPEDHLPVTGHTDGGGTYRSNLWKDACTELNVTRSMSRKSCCPDNAPAEGFFGTIKEEFYYGRDWSVVSPQRFIVQLDDHLRWHRDKRLKSFKEDGKIVYDTISGRRKRLGYAV